MTWSKRPDKAIFSLFEWTFDPIAVWAPDPWRIVYSNRAFWEQMRPPSDGPLGEGFLALLEPSSQAFVVELLEQLHRTDAPAGIRSACVPVRGGGSFEIRLCRLSNDEPSIAMIIRANAVTAAKGAAPDQRRDPLTGLFDREFLLDRLAARLQGGRSADRQFAVLFLDLDNFKQVNDEFGHLIGDIVLREAARRIANCVRDGDHVVRFGGDEFVVLVQGIVAATEVEPVIGRIQTAMAKPIAMPEGEVTLALSVGMALASEGHSSPEELLSAADRAMYAAKRDLGLGALPRRG